MTYLTLPVWLIIAALFGPLYFWFLISDEFASKK